MARIHFQIAQVTAGRDYVIVSGRCCEGEIAVGDVFTSLERSRFGAYDDKTRVWPQTRESPVIGVNLRVEEISFYSCLIDRLHQGGTAGIRLTGERCESLRLFVEAHGLSLWGETGGES